jgi:hypothetical protein
MNKTISTFTVPDDWDGKQHGLASVAMRARFPCIGQRCWDNPHGPWHDVGTHAFPYRDVKYCNSQYEWQRMCVECYNQSAKVRSIDESWLDIILQSTLQLEGYCKDKGCANNMVWDNSASCKTKMKWDDEALYDMGTDVGQLSIITNQTWQQGIIQQSTWWVLGIVRGWVICRVFDDKALRNNQLDQDDGFVRRSDSKVWQLCIMQ